MKFSNRNVSTVSSLPRSLLSARQDHNDVMGSEGGNFTTVATWGFWLVFCFQRTGDIKINDKIREQCVLDNLN